MKKLAIALLPLTLVGCQQQSLWAEDAQATEPGSNNPIVIELFQSQGCSSCPPANAAFNAIAGRKDLIALSFSVTYWDRLGWKDSFARPAFTQRQYDYAKSLRGEGVYTPQIVLNGKRAIVGSGPGELNRAVAATRPVSGSPKILRDGGSVKIGAGTGNATVWLVRYDPKVQRVPISAGENNGRTLPHKNIVRQLDRIGAWNGKPTRLALTKSGDAAWQSVILVQREQTGPIISAIKI